MSTTLKIAVHRCSDPQLEDYEELLRGHPEKVKDDCAWDLRPSRQKLKVRFPSSRPES